MKKLLLLLSCVSFITNPMALRAVPADVSRHSAHSATAEALREGRAVDGPPKADIKKAAPAADEPTRLITTGDLGAASTCAAFAGKTFLVGDKGNATDQLASVKVYRDAGEWKEEFVAQALANMQKNGAGVANQDSPFKANNFGPLVLVPGITDAGDPGVFGTNDQALTKINFQLVNKKIFYTSADDLKSSAVANSLNNPIPVAATGKKVRYDDTAANNAAFAFAATCDTQIWGSNGANHHAIAPIMVKAAGTALQPVKFDAITAGANGVGAPISPAAADALIAIDGNATIKNASAYINLCWDDKLERLYGALWATASNNANHDALGLFMGRFDLTDHNGKLLLKPIAPLVDGDYVAATSVFVDKQQAVVQCKNPCVMHTSTGKDYLIFSGGTTAEHAWVSAVGLVATDADPNNVGQVSKVDVNGRATFQPIDGVNAPSLDKAHALAALTIGEKAIVVGGHPSYLSQAKTQAPSALFVSGDTVYCCMAGERIANHNNESGIFASSAIFSESGAIRAWTPWQRVGAMMGGSSNGGGASYDTLIPEMVYNAAVDPNTSKFYWVGGNSLVAAGASNKKRAPSTVWYAGDADTTGETVNIHTSAHAGVPLSPALKSLQDNGGVYGLFAFDGDTPGFAAPVAAYDKINLMVATGNGRVALIDTGEVKARTSANVVAGVFESTLKFVAGDHAVDATGANLDDTKKVVVFSGGDLTNLGPITCAEVGRLPITAAAHAGAGPNGSVQNGWLFVGGQGGLAVLSNKTTGDGWVTTGNDDCNNAEPTLLAQYKLSGLGTFIGAKDGSFPGGKLYNFNQLKHATESFTNIRKLVADGTYLYILTADKLHRLELSADDFKGAVIGGNRLKTIASVATGVGLPGFKESAGNTQVLDLDRGDQFTDFMMTKVNLTGPVYKIAIGTTKGLYLMAADKDAGALVDGSVRWNRNVNTAGDADFPLGPVLRMDFVNAARGGSKAAAAGAMNDGNLYVTAFTAVDSKDIAVYRFNVAGGTVKAITEPYKTAAGDPTKYFYKIGTVSDDLANKNEFAGPLDMVANAETVGHNNSDFFSILPVPVDPSEFLQDFTQDDTEIDLKQPISSYSQLAKPVIDTASGAMYLPIANLNGDSSVAVIVNE